MNFDDIQFNKTYIVSNGKICVGIITPIKRIDVDNILTYTIQPDKYGWVYTNDNWNRIRDAHVYDNMVELKKTRIKNEAGDKMTEYYALKRIFEGNGVSKDPN